MHLFSLCFYVFILSVRAAAFQSASLLNPISVLTKGAYTGRLNRPDFNLPGKNFAASLLSFSFGLQSTTFLVPQKCIHRVQHAKKMYLLVSHMSLKQTLAIQIAKRKVLEKL